MRTGFWTWFPGTAAGCCSARSSGADGQPFEIQLLEFPSTAAFNDYMTDGRRLSLADDRDRAIARTQVIDVDLIQSG
jgi:hypothetical protein